MAKTFLDVLKERDLTEAARAACAGTGAAVEELAAPKRARHLTRARTNFARYLREEMGWSLAAIGELLHRDHSVISHLLRKVPQ
ncbi:MAG: hypothetical protein IPK82_23340 [Polyangiaceae bacterium]|nr:hypothetical protein [Polyangiaceae bacterium]